jgi:hypothetical protein
MMHTIRASWPVRSGRKEKSASLVSGAPERTSGGRGCKVHSLGTLAGAGGLLELAPGSIELG